MEVLQDKRLLLIPIGIEKPKAGAEELDWPGLCSSFGSHLVLVLSSGKYLTYLSS